MGYAEDIRAFNEWLLTHRLNATEKLLWYRIRFKFDEAGDPKRLAIGSAVLMEMEGLSEPTFRRARKTLVTAKLIKTIQVKGQSTVYELLPIIKDGLREPSEEPSHKPSSIPSEEPSHKPSSDQSGELARPAHARAREDTYVSSIAKNNIIYYNSIPNSLSYGNSGGGAGEDERETPRAIWEKSQLEPFDRFWGLYPRKEGRKQAWEAWLTIMAGNDVEANDIYYGLVSAKGSRQWEQDGGRYIPGAARWLLERRWTDVMQKNEELPF